MPVWTLLFSVQDAKQAISTTEINLPEATSETNATLMAVRLSQLISPLIAGEIVRVGISKEVDVSGLPAGELESDVEEGARFQFRTSGGHYTALRLAAFDEEFMLPGTENVDISDGTVSAFIAAMVNGVDLSAFGGSGTVQPCDKRGETVTELSFAREQFQGERG